MTKVDWTNPHVWIYFNVKDQKSGQMTKWGFEMGPPHGLQRSGWRRETLKIGEEVTVDGFLAQATASKRMNARHGDAGRRPAGGPGADARRRLVEPRRTARPSLPQSRIVAMKRRALVQRLLALAAVAATRARSRTRRCAQRRDARPEAAAAGPCAALRRRAACCSAARRRRTKAFGPRGSASPSLQGSFCRR